MHILSSSKKEKTCDKSYKRTIITNCYANVELIFIPIPMAYIAYLYLDSGAFSPEFIRVNCNAEELLENLNRIKDKPTYLTKLNQ